jgi:lysophospholipase L1-like esterase
MASLIPQCSTILFQGDSITDTGRSRDDTCSLSTHALGSGYASMAAAQLLCNRAHHRLHVYNRGISGNRIVDLYARIRCDTINLKPDLLSVLIGVNDTWHGFVGNNGVDIPKYERIYRDYLHETLEANPKIRFVLCEPFVLRCGVVTEDWIAEMTQRRAVVKKLAEEFGATFVPFQQLFDEAVKTAPPEYWARDGVHPSAAGHCLMAQAWLSATGEE